jgi:RNA polymerase sigma-70 factor (ECF subfamily)
MVTIASANDNHDSFETLLLKNMKMLTGFSIKLTRGSDNANDLVQETLMKALKNRDKFREGTNFGAWTCTILRRLHYEQFRNRRREVPDSDGTLVSTFKSCPEQTALMLVGGLGYSYEEAAVITNCPLGTLKSRVNRARRKIKNLLN